jgi:predicted lipoprotein with Yx(FWY)xxD motif
MGKPLYLFVGDQKTGDKTGDGVGGVWRVVK